MIPETLTYFANWVYNVYNTSTYMLYSIHIHLRVWCNIHIICHLFSKAPGHPDSASLRYCLPGALPAEWPWGARLPAGAGAQGGALGMGISQKWAKFGMQNRLPNPNSPSVYLDHLIDLSIHHTSITIITLMGDGTSWLMHTGVESLFVELCVVDGL